MPNIIVREITKDNWEEAFGISVYENQRAFVPSVVESIAFAYLKPWDAALDPYALYDNDSIIGAFYISYTPGSEHNYWIGGFQIDKKYQGNGYGKDCLYKILEFIKKTYPTCKIKCTLCKGHFEKA